MAYNKEEINRLLKGKRHKGEEDLLIHQPDGTKACAGWELTQGYHLVDLKKKRELTDAELMSSAYKELEKRKKNYSK
ncbi:hypothetical protein M0R19_01210 [Candidatus Pacearchaeota archaeon]|nr:hypothetical protein [Candidatus Pacearchaeota archaeon]